MLTHPAVKQAKKTSDYLVLWITFFLLFLMTSAYFIFEAFTNPEITSSDGGFSVFNSLLGALVGGGLVFLILLLLGMFMVRMMRQTMIGNSLQVEYSDYAWLRDWANQVSNDFRLPRVEILITQDPYINAYAYGFARPYNIVLHSGSIRYLNPEELKTVVVHEMAHIKYGHTVAQVYLQPFVSIPIVGIVTGWISGFWSRRAELTADRLALMYTRDPELVKKSLAKVHIGPDAAKYLNQIAEQWLHYNADRPMNRFAQTFSSHPFLVRRLGQIDKYAAHLVAPRPPIRPAHRAASESSAQSHR